MIKANPKSEFPDYIDPEILEKQLKNLQSYMRMQQLYNGAIREMKTKLEVLDDEFHVRTAHNPIHHIESRQKTLKSIIEKLIRNNRPITIESARENLNDIAGIRVICYYIEDVYTVARMLKNQSDITLVRERDYIREPKENGYRSLHLVVKIPVFLSSHSEQVPVEIQLRTIAMDLWASLEHQMRYKAETNVPFALRERLKQCAEDCARIDNEMQKIHREIDGQAPQRQA